MLAAFEVPDGDEAAFATFLEGLGYPSVAEAGNAAYGLFLGNG